MAKAQAERGCFDGRWDSFARLITLTDRSIGSGVSLEHYLGFGVQGASRLRGMAPGPEVDREPAQYAESRLLLIDNSLHFYGEPGLIAFNQAIDRDDHRAMIDALAARLEDPAFLAAQRPDTARLQLLVAHALNLRPCWAGPLTKNPSN